jgi:transposase
LKEAPSEEVYQLKKEVLGEFEQFARNGWIDLYYGDESRVQREACVPFGWQFADERAAMPTAKGKAVNCFGLFTRENQSWTAMSQETITSEYVIEQLERFSQQLRKLTVVVLDNARIHRTKAFAERMIGWQERGLFIFYLPKASPHLNLAETVWRKLKYEWLSPADYESKEQLRYAVWQALRAFGRSLKIEFSDFNDS